MVRSADPSGARRDRCSPVRAPGGDLQRLDPDLAVALTHPVGSPRSYRSRSQWRGSLARQRAQRALRAVDLAIMPSRSASSLSASADLARDRRIRARSQSASDNPSRRFPVGAETDASFDQIVMDLSSDSRAASVCLRSASDSASRVKATASPDWRAESSGASPASDSMAWRFDQRLVGGGRVARMTIEDPQHHESIAQTLGVFRSFWVAGIELTAKFTCF